MSDFKLTLPMAVALRDVLMDVEDYTALTEKLWEDAPERTREYAKRIANETGVFPRDYGMVPPEGERPQTIDDAFRFVRAHLDVIQQSNDADVNLDDIAKVITLGIWPEAKEAKPPTRATIKIGDTNVMDCEARFFDDHWEARGGPGEVAVVGTADQTLNEVVIDFFRMRLARGPSKSWHQIREDLVRKATVFIARRAKRNENQLRYMELPDQSGALAEELVRFLLDSEAL